MSGSEIHEVATVAVQGAAESSNRKEAIDNLINDDTNQVTNGGTNRNPRPENIILKSCEGTEFKVPLEVAEQSRLVKTVLGADALSNCVPLPAVTAPVVELMISFWTKHLEFDKFTKEQEDEVWDWERRFFNKMNRELLFEFVLAANYVDAKEMLDSACNYMAGIIKDMSVEDVREFFGIVNDFTPEEERRVCEENRWAFE